MFFVRILMIYYVLSLQNISYSTVFIKHTESSYSENFIHFDRVSLLKRIWESVAYQYWQQRSSENTVTVHKLYHCIGTG
jgi:hypothetical protein